MRKTDMGLKKKKCLQLRISKLPKKLKLLNGNYPVKRL